MQKKPFQGEGVGSEGMRIFSNVFPSPPPPINTTAVCLFVKTKRTVVDNPISKSSQNIFQKKIEQTRGRRPQHASTDPTLISKKRGWKRERTLFFIIISDVVLSSSSFCEGGACQQHSSSVITTAAIPPLRRGNCGVGSSLLEWGMEEKGAEATEEEECGRDGVGRESLSGTAAWSKEKWLVHLRWDGYLCQRGDIIKERVDYRRNPPSLLCPFLFPCDVISPAEEERKRGFSVQIAPLSVFWEMRFCLVRQKIVFARSKPREQHLFASLLACTLGRKTALSPFPV